MSNISNPGYPNMDSNPGDNNLNSNPGDAKSDPGKLNSNPGGALISDPGNNSDPFGLNALYRSPSNQPLPKAAAIEVAQNRSTNIGLAINNYWLPLESLAADPIEKAIGKGGYSLAVIKNPSLRSGEGENGDRVVIHYSKETGTTVFGIVDAMGGHGHTNIAANSVANTIATAAVDNQDLARIEPKLFLDLNKIRELKDTSAGAVYAIASISSEGVLDTYSAGDAPICVIRNGQVLQVTAIEGELNMVENAVTVKGPSSVIRSIKGLQLQPGDVVLGCTDGIFDNSNPNVPYLSFAADYKGIDNNRKKEAIRINNKQILAYITKIVGENSGEPRNVRDALFQPVFNAMKNKEKNFKTDDLAIIVYKWHGK